MPYDPKTYKEAVFYEEGPYLSWMLDQVASYFHKSTDPKLCDVGAGPGSFTLKLADQLSVSHENVVCVEPQLEFCEVISGLGMNPIQATASEFFGSTPEMNGFDYILLKEAVHFIPDDELVPVLAKAHSFLKDGPSRLLLVCRPGETALPFFKAAQEVYRKQTAPIEHFVSALEEAGFQNVQMHEETYRCEIPLRKWCDMLRGRFWSTLFGFSDAELEEGIEEVMRNRGKEDLVQLNDIVCFVTGEKLATE